MVFGRVFSQETSNLHFGIVSDIQYCDCDAAGSREYRGVPDKLRTAIDTLEEKNIEFLLNLGDLINKNWNSFDTILPILNSIPVDIYSLLGNHDFYNLSEDHMDSLTTLLNMPSRYYTFKKGDWRIIMLDANEMSTYAYPDGSDEKTLFADYINNMNTVNAQNWNGGILSNQLVWLRNILSTADTLGEYVIVAGHPNIYPMNMNTMLNYQEVANILEAHNSVKMYVCGHWHEGGYVYNSNIHYLNVKAMLDYPDSTAFSVVDITDSDIIVNGFGREPDRTLPYNSEYTLTINDGLGSGTYRQGSLVQITSQSPSDDKAFSYWSGDIGVLSSATDSTVSFPMPAFDISLSANFFSVGIKENAFLNLHLFPNPVKNMLRIENPNKIDEIQIFDLSGKKLVYSYPQSSKFVVDMSELTQGIYFIRLRDENGNICNKKIIK